MFRKTDLSEDSGACTGTTDLFPRSTAVFWSLGSNRFWGSRTQLTGCASLPTSDLFIHQTNHKLLVGLAQAILLNNFVPGQHRRRDDYGVGHISSMIPRFA